MIISVIEDQILPRLLHAHPALMTIQSGASLGEHVLLQQESKLPLDSVNEFMRHCIEGAAISYVEQLQDQGIGHEVIYMDLITPAARLLGKQWEEDHIDFMQVTSALIHMHEVVHFMNYHMQPGPKAVSERKRIVLACAPGSQHILGIVIVGAFFNRAGWQTVVEVSATSESLGQLLADEWFDVIGLSVALESQCGDLAGLISDLRTASRNKNVFVMLGGPAFCTGDFDAGDFGAHAICSDAGTSLLVASSAMGI
jgi:methanogenic corrinoid protein MtbC1